MLNITKGLSAFELTVWILCLILFFSVFVYGEPFLHFWHKNSLIVAYSLCSVLVNLVLKYFIENFCICSHGEIDT